MIGLVILYLVIGLVVAAIAMRTLATLEFDELNIFLTSLLFWPLLLLAVLLAVVKVRIDFHRGKARRNG